MPHDFYRFLLRCLFLFCFIIYFCVLFLFVKNSVKFHVIFTLFICFIMRYFQELKNSVIFVLFVIPLDLSEK